MVEVWAAQGRWCSRAGAGGSTTSAGVSISCQNSPKWAGSKTCVSNQSRSQCADLPQVKHRYALRGFVLKICVRFMFSLCPLKYFMTGKRRVLGPWGPSGTGSTCRHQLSGSWGHFSWLARWLCLLLLGITVPLFWELQQFCWQKFKCFPLRVRKLNWGENPPNPFVCSNGEPEPWWHL